MSNWLGNKTPAKVKFNLTVVATAPAGKQDQVANDLQTIINSTSPEELALIRKVVTNPLVKNMALAQASKYL